MWEIYLGHVDAEGFGKDQASFPTDLVFLILANLPGTLHYFRMPPSS